MTALLYHHVCGLWGQVSLAPDILYTPNARWTALVSFKSPGCRPNKGEAHLVRAMGVFQISPS